MAAPASSPSALALASPSELGRAIAWRATRFGFRRARHAAMRLPRATLRVERFIRSRGPVARAADRGWSIWSTDSKISVASVKSQGSALSAWSLWSGGSVFSVGSIASVASVGSAGSILSIGSAGSILSIGAAGSVLSIGGVNQRPWRRRDGEAADEVDAGDARRPIAEPVPLRPTDDTAGR